MIRECECCNFSTVYKQVFDKHLQSKRHIKLTKNEIHNENHNEKHSESQYYNECNLCGKKFKSYSSLRKHKNECITPVKITQINDSTNVVPVILQYLNSNKLKGLRHQGNAKLAESKPNIEDAQILENNTSLSSNDDSNPECKHSCFICNKKFNTRSGLWKHKKKCKKDVPNITISSTDIITPIILEKLNEIQHQIDKGVKVEKEQIKGSSGIVELNTIEIQERGNNDTFIQLESSKKRIEQLEKTYLKKQKRHHFVDNNVIYIVTTEDNKLKRNYIVGKARNLTLRLSTYNKTAEHEVVYHRKCPDEHTMNIIESVVMKKLEKYRECANRDRFILPEDADISLFTNTVDASVAFFE